MIHLKAHACLDLDGTHEAVVCTDLSSVGLQLEGTSGEAIFLKVSSGGRECVCRLRRIEFSESNVLEIDSVKLAALGIRNGASLAIERVKLPPAKRIVVKIPENVGRQELELIRGRPLRRGDTPVLKTPLAGKPRTIKVLETNPDQVVHITNETVIEHVSGGKPEPISVAAGLRFSDIGGLDREIQVLREVVVWPLRDPEAFAQLGIPGPTGVILEGGAGTGKTMLIRALCNEVGGVWFSAINGGEFYDRYYGETERKIRDLFTQARQHAPAIVLIDELDALVPNRDTARGEVEHRVVATLLTLMDGIKKQPGVVVIGTTNRLSSIDPALRRDGRFGLELHIGVPDMRGREQILRILTRRMPLADDVDLARLAMATVGYVGADLQKLCRAAAHAALREEVEIGDPLCSPEAPALAGIQIRQAHFDSSLASIRPSAMKDFAVEVPKVNWADVCGLDEIKQILIENAVYPIQRHAAYLAAGLKPARGILFSGLPGTGKTLLAKAVATESGVNIIPINSPEILSRFLGDSEAKIREIFKNAREVAPCVIIFDEIDAIAATRGQKHFSGGTDAIVNQLLTEMDGLQSTEGVFVIGTTNRLDAIDPALLRSGRFDYKVEVPLPTAAARQAMFRKSLLPGLDLSDPELGKLADLTETMSGADIAEICRQAILDALRIADFDPARFAPCFQDVMAAAERIRLTKSTIEPRKIGFTS